MRTAEGANGHNALERRRVWRRFATRPTLRAISAGKVERIDPTPRSRRSRVQRRAAEVVIAETGGDMTAFATAGHLASWAGVCPGNDESAGKRRSGRTRKGSKWLRGVLIEAARAAARTHDTYLAAQYQRVRARRGANSASRAVAHSLLTAVWHMLQTGDLHRPRRRLLHAPRPRPHDPTPHRPARTLRPHRHPHGRGGWLTNGIFSSETKPRRRPGPSRVAGSVLSLWPKNARSGLLVRPRRPRGRRFISAARVDRSAACRPGRPLR
jgi:hypothetical protein